MTMHAILNRSPDYHVRLHGAFAPTAPLLGTDSNTAPGSCNCFEVTEVENENEMSDEARSQELQATAYAKTIPPRPS